MFDIFKRKKPNTLTSSHQPTPVVDNYAHYASMPKSSSQVDENHDSLSSASSTLVGDNYAHYASMPKSSQVDENYDSLSSGSSTLVGDHYAHYAPMPKPSSQVDENYAPMPSVPSHLRRKIRDNKESVPTPREQYRINGGKIICKYPKEA